MWRLGCFFCVQLGNIFCVAYLPIVGYLTCWFFSSYGLLREYLHVFLNKREIVKASEQPIKWRNKEVSNYHLSRLLHRSAKTKRILHQPRNTPTTLTHLSILTPPAVPMQQYPQSPDITGGPQPPVYQDPASAQYAQSQPKFQQQPQQQHPMQPQHTGSFPAPQSPGPHDGSNGAGYDQHQQQKAYPGPHQQQQQPGMPPQQPSGPVYQNATPLANLNRGPAPADCPACGQRSMTNCDFETGNTTQ